MFTDVSLLAVAGLLLLLLACLLVFAGMLLTRQALGVVTDTVRYLVKGWRDNGTHESTPFQQVGYNAQRLDALEAQLDHLEKLLVELDSAPRAPPH